MSAATLCPSHLATRSPNADLLPTGRILIARFRVGEFDVRESVNPYRRIPHSVAASAEHTDLAYQAAVQGMILLHNPAAILPLSKAKLRKGVAVVGPNANDATIMLGNCANLSSSVLLCDACD